MKTLNKEHTRSFFKSEDGYNKAVEIWKSYVKDNPRESIPFFMFLIYSVIRGKDWRKACSPLGKKKGEGQTYPYSPFYTTKRAWGTILYNSPYMQKWVEKTGLSKILVEDWNHQIVTKVDVSLPLFTGLTSLEGVEPYTNGVSVLSL